MQIIKRFINTFLKTHLRIQVFLVVVSFAAMVALSYFYVSMTIVRGDLREKAVYEMSLAGEYIMTSFYEPRMALALCAHSVNDMLLSDKASMAEIQTYMAEVSKASAARGDSPLSLNGVYGYFDVFGGAYLSGNGQSLALADHEPAEQPWYIAAQEANGEIAATDIYIHAESGLPVVTFARQLKGENGEQLAIVAIDVMFDSISDTVSNMSITENGYGFLLDQNMVIKAHKYDSLINQPFRNIPSGIIKYAGALERDGFLEEVSAKSYDKLESVFYARRLANGWYLLLVTPRAEYYATVNLMLVVISLFGAGLAAGLSVILMRLNAAKEKADVQNRQKSNFLATMSHEMRTPLNAILGIAEIYMADETLAPDVTEALGKIYYSGDLLLRIINDLLDLSKIEAGKLEIMPVNYEVASLINDTVHLNMMRYESKPLEFKLHVDENVPAVMFGDELRIKQILNNLLSNAFKYTEKGEINFYISAETVQRGSMLHYMMVFRVSDTGAGMSREQQAKLFDAYSRFNTEMNRTVSGTGLGMSIAQNLARLMHGTIAVESELGLGTVFTLKLPQEKVGGKTLGTELAKNLEQFNFLSGPQTKGSHIMRDYMPYGRVLIVDDVETNLYVAQGLLTPYGINTETVTSGFECLNKIEEGNVYDIIFMDHMMPKMDGIECTKKLRASGYDYPVVALTANAVVGQAEIFLQNGFDGFISKPIDIRQLNMAVNQFVRDKQPPEVLEDARNKQIQMAEELAKPKPKDAELAKIFVRDALKTAEVLETIFTGEALNENDLQTYIINVHAMKSALFAVKENDLSKVAQRLEQAGREKDHELITAQTPVFLSALRGVIAKNTPAEEPEAPVELNAAEQQALDGALGDIEAACEAYDKRKAKNLLAGLKEKKWPKSVSETLDKLSEHILHSDFEDAAALAKAALKRAT